MSKRPLPQVGQKIAASKFFVSKMNVRHGQPFGDTKRDKLLIANLRRAKNHRPVHPIKARPEGNRFGVYAGRRKLLALKQLQQKEFIVGEHCLIDHLSDDEARMASWIENLRDLQDDMDPITRAKGLNEVLSTSTVSLRMFARMHGFSPSTLTEWLSVLELSPKMQKVVEKGSIYYTDALKLTRMKLGTEKQDKLAELVETAGVDAFKSELARLQAGKGKRGIPAGKYSIIRVTWDKRYPPDVKDLKKLDELAKAKEMERDEYAKCVLREHVKSAG